MSRRYLLRRLILLPPLLILVGGAVSCREEIETGPRAWIDHPRDGATVPPDTTVTVISHAHAREGVAELLLSVNGEPYRRGPPAEPGAAFTQVELEWLPEEEGEYTLQVTAYDTGGEASSPATITVRVGSRVSEAPTHTPVPPAPPTDTPVPPTHTPVPPTHTPVPPTPTFTPTPVPSAQVDFWTERGDITSGECTILHWGVEHATAVYLNGESVSEDGTRQVCPSSTTTYHLHVEAPSGNVDRSVTVNVSAPADTTPPPVPSPAVPADGLDVTCRSTQTLVWMPVSDPSGVNYYVKLERQVTPGQWESVRGWGPVSGKQVDADVDCGIYYRWAVRAQDGAGNYSAWSTWSYFSVLLN